MKKIGSRGQRWLKCFHIFFSSMWVGGAISLLTVNVFLNAENGMERYGIDVTMKFIDDIVIIIAAVGCLITSLLYSIFTNWGWFKHRWITVKWIILLYGIISGTFFLGPWLNSLPPLSKAEGMSVLMNQFYMNNKHMLWYLGTFQVVICIFAVFISVLKPWKNKNIE